MSTEIGPGLRSPSAEGGVTLRLAAEVGRLATFCFAAMVGFALTFNASFVELFPNTRLAVFLVIALSIHVLRQPRLLFCREAAIYSVFVAYMFLQLFWTYDWDLARNTLVPAVNFVLILILGGSLATYYDIKAVVTGMLAGFLLGAVLYTLTVGFPFRYPADFSYNAVALVYLFGLFLALMTAFLRSSRFAFPVLALVVMVHIVATTSIKTNLGIALGVLAAGLAYFQHILRLVWRNAVLLLLILSVLGYLVLSNESLMGALERGATRVTLGFEILQAREDLPGYSSFENRVQWRRDGLEGWAANPVFGNGVESFRWRHGTTSHSTPIDLLHNSGLVGLVLFYSVLASFGWRLFSGGRRCPPNLRLLFFGTLVCFTFITLSGTMHYNAFLSMFIAIGVATLGHYRTLSVGAARTPR